MALPSANQARQAVKSAVITGHSLLLGRASRGPFRRAAPSVSWGSPSGKRSAQLAVAMLAEQHGGVGAAVPLLEVVHSGSEAPHVRLAGGAGAFLLAVLEDSASAWLGRGGRSLGKRK